VICIFSISTTKAIYKSAVISDAWHMNTRLIGDVWYP